MLHVHKRSDHGCFGFILKFITSGGGGVFLYDSLAAIELREIMLFNENPIGRPRMIELDLWVCVESYISR